MNQSNIVWSHDYDYRGWPIPESAPGMSKTEPSEDQVCSAGMHR